MKGKLKTTTVRENLLEYLKDFDGKLPFEHYYGYTIYGRKYLRENNVYVLLILLSGKKWVCSFRMSDDPFFEAVEKYFELPYIELKSFQL